MLPCSCTPRLDPPTRRRRGWPRGIALVEGEVASLEIVEDRRRRIRHGPRSGGGGRDHHRCRRPHRVPATRPRPHLPPRRLRPGLRPVPALADRVSPRPRPARGGERRDARWPPADRRPRLGQPLLVGRPRGDAGPARAEPRLMAHRKARSPRARGYRPEWAEGHRHRQRHRCQTPRAVSSPPARRRPLLIREIVVALFSENPRRVLLGKWASGIRASGIRASRKLACIHSHRYTVVGHMRGCYRVLRVEAQAPCNGVG
jgi:hypothetical protein